VTLRPRARAALEEILGRPDPGIRGVVLSGSAARGMATEHSDVDVYVVWAEPADRVTSRSDLVDEIPTTLAELEHVAPFGSVGWWTRWSFAWAEVLRDDTGGRVADAVRRQAVLSSAEQRHILTEGDRLDGWINFAYRALKSDRDGRALERRLDAAESVAWLLDVVFTLAGRVRPYNKYLAWELREHPLDVPEWSAARLLPVLRRTLDGDPAALRETFAVVDREVRRHDADRGTTVLGDLIDGWGAELVLFRGAGTTVRVEEEPT
jgi:predicted nucleotidyltransferase